MAKKKVVIGSIVKGQNGKADYLKVRGSHTLADGQFLNLESPKSQLESLEKAVAEGKLSEEIAVKIRERIEKIPAFVRFEVTTLVDKE